jgi:hypothetical protein
LHSSHALNANPLLEDASHVTVAVDDLGFVALPGHHQYRLLSAREAIEASSRPQARCRIKPSS